MKCDAIRNLMSAYIDKDLNDIEKTAFEKHLAQCSECREEYELLLELVLECNNVEDVELPEGFREELHERLAAEKANKAGFINRIGKNRWKAAAGLVAAVLVVAVGIGSMDLLNNGRFSTTKSETDMADYGQMAPAAPEAAEAGRASEPSKGKAAPGVNFAMDNGGEAAAPEAPPVITGAGDGKAEIGVMFSESLAAQNAPASGGDYREAARKVIKSGYLSLKVKDVNNAVNDIKNLTNQRGGFVESSQVDNYTVSQTADPATGKIVGEATITQANMSIRIPADRFDEAMNTIKAMGKPVSENINGSDITSVYRDTNSRVENLKIQEKRLQELMTKTEKVNELIQVENELNRIRTEIEIQTGQLRQWDNLVALSTLQVNLVEEKDEVLAKVDVPDLWDEAYKGFISAVNTIIKGLQALFILAVTSVPYLAAAGVLALAGLIGYRRFKKNRK